MLERSREEGVKVTSHLLNSVRKLGQLSVYVPRERWDANPDILVFANGTLEISERRFREHKPEDVTSALPYAYDPEAACEVSGHPGQRGAGCGGVPTGVRWLLPNARYIARRRSGSKVRGVRASPRLSRAW